MTRRPDVATASVPVAAVDTLPSSQQMVGPLARGPADLEADRLAIADHRSAIEARLRARFPEVSPAALSAEIDRVVVTFADARITAYLPVLAERSVAEALSRRR